MSTLRSSLLCVLACFFALAGLSAAPKPRGESPVRTHGDAVVKEIVSVLDGQTFIVNLRDLPPIIGEHIPVRLFGIECPDLRDSRPEVRRLAMRAKQISFAELRAGRVVKLRNMRRDKMSFRILADVEVDGRSLAKTLIDGGYARPVGGAVEKGKR